MRGFGIDASGQVFGTNGTSEIFEVIISDTVSDLPDYIVSEDSLPYFLTFPKNVAFVVEQDQTDTILLQATAYSAIGLEYIVADTGKAISFV